MLFFGAQGFCGECGNTMWKNSFVVRGERHSYLACRTRKTVNNGCPNAHQIQLEYLEDYVTDKINELLADYRSGKNAKHFDASEEEKRISEEIRGREAEIDRNDQELA